ncbi:MAG: hypothetical protein ACI936_001297 [Paraglaciecola sp.]
MLYFKGISLIDEQQISSISTKQLWVLSALISDVLRRSIDTLEGYSENRIAALLPYTYLYDAKHTVQKLVTSVPKQR